MAANLEQIFQDFILNKIKEIEDLNEDQAAAGGVDTSDGMIAKQNSTSDRSRREDLGTQKKKHKKHKKHKSKKKKKNREKEQKESSSESGDESDHGSKQPRGERLTEENKEQGEKSNCHKRHSTGKRKKKKRKKEEDGSSSASDSEFVNKKDSKYGPSALPWRQEDLPDIIPKQDSSSKGRDQDRLGRRRSCSRSPSHSCSHSCSLGTNCHCKSKQNRRSRTRSSSSPHRHSTRSRSREKNPVPDESAQFIQTDPQDAPTGPVIRMERMIYSNTEKKEETTALMVGSATSQSTTNKSTCGETETRPDAPTPPTTTTSAPKLKSSRSRQSSSSPTVTSSSSTKPRRRTPSSSQRRKEHKSSKRTKRSRTPCRSRRRGSRSRTRSRSRSPLRKKRSRSRSEGRRSRRSRSRSASLGRKRNKYSQRDRWRREPSHSPVLILRKNRSPTWKHCSSTSSPQRISELDKEQLLEIAKANAAAMCAKAGMPIPASLRSSVLPLALPTMAMNAAMASMTAATVTAALSNIGTLSSLLPLPSITNKPPSAPAQSTASALEDVKKKVEKQANSISIKEFTEKCRMIVDSKGELPVAVPHVSDEEDDGKPFGGSALREQKAISFSINNLAVRPVVRSDAGIAKEFPVSSGSQHRKKEGETLGAYGEWVPIGKTADKAPCSSRKAPPTAPVASANTASADTETAAGSAAPVEPSGSAPNNDSVFPDPPSQHVDISQAVTERIRAQRRLAENPYDVSAICMLSRAQEQVDAWAQSNTVPGLFTGSTGAQVLSSEELSMSGPQAWLKKDQFLRAAPVSGGVGEFLMRKMGWRTGEGLGRNREGTVEPIIIDFKVDRKGLVAEGEKPQKQTGGLVVTKDLMGKHPVSALIELCNKKRIMQPDFVMVHHSGPDHRKNFLFKVTVNGVDYQPQTASPNKKHAKAMAATVALQAMGEVPADGPGLYTGPVFTAASTGPLFST